MLTNDALALGVADHAMAIGDALGEAAERRVLTAQAQAGAAQALKEAWHTRLKDGTTPEQLAAQLLPKALVAVVKAAAPGTTTLEVPSALAAALTALRAQMGDNDLTALLTQATGSSGRRQTRSDDDPVKTKEFSLGALLDGAAKTF